MRAVTEITPYQEGASQRKALQMRLMKIERDIQAYSVDGDVVANIDVGQQRLIQIWTVCLLCSENMYWQ